jgi:hypothetical protein
MGATCHDDFNDKVTHLVAETAGDDKVKASSANRSSLMKASN